MNKKLSSLEALEKIKYSLADKNGHICLWDRCCLSVIETALKRLEIIEEVGVITGTSTTEEASKEIEEYLANKKKLKALEIIKKYTYSGGWSGDYATEYWKMKAKEIKVIEEVFKDVPCKPLSGKH